MAKVGEFSARVLNSIEQVIIGKSEQIKLCLVALLAEGHVLLEDVPGVAKTILARSMALSAGCDFKRIQCTPDLLPNDITGASIFNPKTTEFEFRRGPIFARMILADEINRATPRAQSAFLEAMAERQVSIDGDVYELERPFFMIATQNPVDHEGTFPLPEAQLDRFLIRLSLGYPEENEEQAMLERMQHGHPIDTIEPVTSKEEIMECQELVRSTYVHQRVREYIVGIVRATREHGDVALGGSPRSTLALCRAAQAWAAMHGYDYVLPDDVKRVAVNVMAHRLLVRPESRLRKINVEGVMAEILRSVPVPTLPASMAVK
ncbi:MoxR family ATPase [Verrucomicrobia bacterium]|nr:MoxR family ATPase [Verrucomicrobiota bacterium]